MTGFSRARWIFTALAVAILTLSAAARADGLQDHVQMLLDDFRTKYGFPGATAAYALPDGSVQTVATGFADLESGIPMTPDSRMLAASIGKSFVAASILALETDGYLQQSDLVSQYLGDRDWFDRLPNHNTMTISDLLRQSYA